MNLYAVRLSGGSCVVCSAASENEAAKHRYPTQEVLSVRKLESFECTLTVYGEGFFNAEVESSIVEHEYPLLHRALQETDTPTTDDQPLTNVFSDWHKSVRKGRQRIAQAVNDEISRGK